MKSISYCFIRFIPLNNIYSMTYVKDGIKKIYNDNNH